MVSNIWRTLSPPSASECLNPLWFLTSKLIFFTLKPVICSQCQAFNVKDLQEVFYFELSYRKWWEVWKVDRRKRPLFWNIFHKKIVIFFVESGFLRVATFFQKSSLLQLQNKNMCEQIKSESSVRLRRRRRRRRRASSLTFKQHSYTC